MCESQWSSGKSGAPRLARFAPGMLGRLEQRSAFLLVDSCSLRVCRLQTYLVPHIRVSHCKNLRSVQEWIVLETVSLLSSKLHRVRITECRVDYVGSIGIDSSWMQQVGLLPLEEVHCWNVTRGTRFVTYAIPSPACSNEVAPNGACAHLCKEGDLLIIAAFRRRTLADVHSRGHRARVLIFGDNNEPAEYLEQHLSIHQEGFDFVSELGFLQSDQSVTSQT